MVFGQGQSSLIHFNLRIMTRQGDVVVDFGEFKDLLSYNDQLSVESPAGSWTIKMRSLTSNEELLRRIHPGMVVEVYACRNDDPLKGVEAFVPQTEEENPPVFTESDESLLAEPYAPVEGKPAPPPEAEDADYLDLAPYLLLRGITSSYGRNSGVVEGTGAETSLTLSGESYGAVYRNCQVLVDRNAPTALGKELQTRLNTQNVHGVVPLYYGILRHWVEEFWGEPTGWEARTRPIPVPPDVMARVNEGSVWTVLQYLSCEGIFHLFCDHTGALCWEKLPWSGRCQALIDEFMSWNEGHQFRNWDDLGLIDCPSHWIQSWADRLSCDRLANYLRVQMTQYGGSGASGSNMDAGQAYNMGSIRQYGGPRRMEVQFPAGTVPFATYDEVERTEAESRVTQFIDRAVMELIRWYDRPVQRCIFQVRGDSGWRINARVRVTENWHNLKAEPAEYYILSRSHSINIQAGNWSTQVECLRDRRTRYLGIGLPPVAPKDMGTAADGILAPTEVDEYWWFNRDAGSIEKIEDYDEFVKPWTPADCQAEEGEAAGDEATPTSTPNNTDPNPGQLVNPG